MINIDIHTKRISSETRIYIARPGARYRFFTNFVENSFVGPDLPGLDLPRFVDLDQLKDLEERVKRSIALRRHAIRADDNLPFPSDDLDDYDGGSTRGTSQLTRLVRAYFGTMAKGDLVILPPHNFKGQAEIGELASDPMHLKQISVPIYGEHRLSGRNVRWLASIAKAQLPAQTLDALQKPNPLFLLARPAWPAIFRRAYGSYVSDDEYGARFEVTSEKYQTRDDFLITAFFNFVAANSNRVAEGNEEMLSLRDGAFSTEGLAPDLFTNVNSPGGLSLKSTLITPIIVAVMFSLAIVVGPDAYSAAMDGTLIFGNSLAPAGDSCVTEVSEQVVTQLTLLGYDQWAEACEAARRASGSTGLSTTVDIQP